MKKIILAVILSFTLCAVTISPALAAEIDALPLAAPDAVIATEIPAPSGPIDQTTATENSERSKIFGDADSNGIIDGADILHLAKKLVGRDGYTVDKTFSDVNFDGTTDMLDLAILQRHLAEWDGYLSLPYGKEVYVSTNDCMPDILYYESLPEHSGLEYEKLTDSQKQMYEIIENAAKNFSSEYLYVNANSLNELCLVYYSVKRDHPEFFWIANGYSYFTYSNKFGLILRYNYETKAEKDAKVELLRAELQDLVDYIGDTDYDDYKLELLIHDWLCNRNEYDYTAAETGLTDTNFNAWTLYGALVSGLSVCEGYAESFQFCLSMFGIRSTVVTGDVHMWNYVMLDGDAYYVDPTWNDSDTISHRYFNLNYADITSSRSFYSDYSDIESASDGRFNYNVPKSTAIKYNYFAQKGTYLTSIDKAEISKKIRMATDTAYLYDETTVIIEFFVSSTLNCTSIDELGVHEAINTINSAGLPYYISGYSHTTNASLPYYKVTLYIEY